nr:tRNA (N6-threonylcarbamoyladenosine(37)-N6)-methyltransferase TrmO [uncultured Halomonas sp.]
MTEHTSYSTHAVDFTLTAIGHVASDYPDKFGVPRQPGLAPAGRGILHLRPPFNDPQAVRGLENVSHLWLTFIFHRSPRRWTPLVRPPRLGGNTRVGVFATRSTHRPNRLGLSLVELEKIETTNGVRLHVRGHDLIDGTPVLDIKPYLPWVESHPDAQAGFAPGPPPGYRVDFSAKAEVALAQRDDEKSLRDLIVQVVGQDPRPAYHQDTPARVYGVSLRDVNVRFCIQGETDGISMHVVDIE